MFKRSITLAVLLAATTTFAAESCLVQAATEFAVPPKVLDAIRTEHAPAKNKALAASEFGPMGLSAYAIEAASKASSIDPSKAKTTPCENYRAAAWFLADATKRTGGDLWQGVGTYYYGAASAGAKKVEADRVIARIKTVSGHTPKP